MPPLGPTPGFPRGSDTEVELARVPGGTRAKSPQEARTHPFGKEEEDRKPVDGGLATCQAGRRRSWLSPRPQEGGTGTGPVLLYRAAGSRSSSPPGACWCLGSAVRSRPSDSGRDTAFLPPSKICLSSGRQQ